MSGKEHSALPEPAPSVVPVARPSAGPLDDVDGQEWLTAAQAAARAGISLSTWSAYRLRGHPRGNPVPGWERRDPDTGVMQWRASTVEAWIARRPGRGARTDKGSRKES